MSRKCSKLHHSTSSRAVVQPPTLAALLAQKAAIVNWQEYSSANNITGWDESEAVCTWIGITCNDANTSVISLYVRPAALVADMHLAGTAGPGAYLWLNSACLYCSNLGCNVETSGCRTPATGTLAPELATIRCVKIQHTCSLASFLSVPTHCSLRHAACRSLRSLVISNQNFSVPLPEKWAFDGAFPQLIEL